MAKTKENQLTYMQMPLPSGQKYYRLPKISWSGLNRRQELDTGELSMEMNISTDEAPYLSPSPKPKRIDIGDGIWQCNQNGKTTEVYPYTPENSSSAPVSLFAFEDILMVVYTSNWFSSTGRTYVDVYHQRSNGSVSVIYTGVLDESPDDTKRDIVRFNVCEDVTDVLANAYDRRFLVFPDCMSFPYIKYVDSENDLPDADELEDENYAEYGGTLWVFPRKNGDGYVFKSVKRKEREIKNEDGLITGYEYSYSWENQTFSTGDTSSKNIFFAPSKIANIPVLKYAVPFQSRLYGVNDSRVFVSSYNDYANWELDTVDEYNSSNAWTSASLTNTGDASDFTGITSYQNHVICFKSDYMHQINNTKNPFRIADLCGEGTIDNRSIQEVNGRLIFVSDGDVLIYTGTTPKTVGYNLGIDKFTYAASGNDGRRYYLYCEDDKNRRYLFVYDTFIGAWSQRAVTSKVLNFAGNNHGLYMLCEDGYLYRVDTEDYTDQEWSFETDLITRQGYSTSSSYSNVDIKHVKKFQLLADLEKGTSFKAYLLYDGEKFDKNVSQCVYDSTKHGGEEKRRITVRVKIRKSAHYSVKLHIEGKGFIRLYEAELFLENGGELYV